MSNETPILPSEEYEAQMIGFAFQELLTQECEELEAEPLTPEEEELLLLAEQNREKHLKLIDRAIKRRSRSMYRRSIVSTALKYAAIFVLVANLSFGTAMAVSPELRTSVIEYLTNVTAPYVRIGAEEVRATVQAPEGWLGDYFPAYVPEGYRVESSNTQLLYSQVVYINSNHEKIICKAYANPSEIQLNAENALCYTVTAARGNAFLYIMDSYSILTWTNNNQSYSFSATTADILLDMFDSLALTSYSESCPVGHVLI